MTRTPEEPFGLAQDKIAAAVAQALRDTLESGDFPQRLEPFTEAQLRFLRQFVDQALTRLLVSPSTDSKEEN